MTSYRDLEPKLDLVLHSAAKQWPLGAPWGPLGAWELPLPAQERFQFNFILSVPGQTVALHLDSPYFLGATRFQVPQWLPPGCI